jgi:hypothetical protein
MVACIGGIMGFDIMTYSMIRKALRESMYSYMGQLNNTSGTYRDIIVDGNYVYGARTSVGIQKIDVTNPTNPVEVATNTTVSQNSTDAQKLYNSYAVKKDGDYIYAASRVGQGTEFTTPTVAITFVDGDADLSNGSSELSGGSKSSPDTNVVSIVGNDVPFKMCGEKYAAKIAWTQGAVTALGYKYFTGGTTNYAQMCIQLGTPTAQDTNYVEFCVFEKGSTKSLKLRFEHSTGTPDTIVLKLLTLHSGGTDTKIAASHLSYNTEYQLRMYYKVDGSAGESWLQIRSSLTGSWQTVCSVSGLNTSANTPDKIKFGISSMSSNYTSGSIRIGQIYVDTVDLDTKLYNEGRIDVLNASDLTIVSTVYLEQKATDIYKLGNLLLVAGQLKGIMLFDATNPASLQHIVTYYTNGTYTLNESVGVCGHDTGTHKYFYLANYWQGLRILDITTPTAPTIVSSTGFDNSYLQVWNVCIDYPYIYGSVNLKEEAYGTSNDKRGLVVYNVTDPANPIKYLYEFPSISKDAFTSGDADLRPTRICKSGNYVYLANGTCGVTVYDVTNPTNAKWIGNIDITDDTSIWAVAADGNRVFIGDGSHTTGSRDLYSYRKVLDI